jgi:Cu/Ag efflux protein CusF
MNRTGRHSARILSVAVACFSIGLMACSSPPKQNDAQTPAAVQPPAAAQSQQTQPQQAQPQRYDLKGKVVSIDKSGKNVTVDHGDIPGFMGAMTMPYPVKDEHLLDNLSPGDQITAKVVSTGGDVWLENIVTVKTGAPPK